MDDEPMGVFAISHEQEIQRSLIERLYHPWDEPPRTIRGNPVPPDALERTVQRVLGDPERAVIPLVPPRIPRDEGRMKMALPQASPMIMLWLSPVPGYVVGDDREASPPPVYHEWHVFSQPIMRYAMLLSPPPGHSMQMTREDDSMRFMDSGERVLHILEGSFGFGGEDVEFVDPNLVDPRSRAWGVTYYGPELVERIGRERIKTAPAHKVVPDPTTGGIWLHLDPLPFIDSPRKTTRRHEVEQHLDLATLFPNQPVEAEGVAD